MPAWAVNKCTAADGKVSFQDAPCAAGKAESLSIKASASTPSTAAPAPKASSGLTQAELNSAIVRGEPLVGMTRAQLDRVMGAPSKVNADNYAGVQKNQIIYERPGATWYVYTDSGIVTAIQNRPSAATVADNRPSVTCPTPLEIRNMETSASSNTIPEGVRVELHRQIRDAKNCGKN